MDYRSNFRRRRFHQIISNLYKDLVPNEYKKIFVAIKYSMYNSFSLKDDSSVSNYFPSGILNLYSNGGGGGGGGGGTMDNPATEDLDMADSDIINVDTITSSVDVDLRLNSNSGDYITVNSSPSTGITMEAVAGKNVVLIADAGNNGIDISGTESMFMGNINVNNYLITDLADPLNDQDASTKAYVDANIGFVSTADADLDMNNNSLNNVDHIDISNTSVLVGSNAIDNVNRNGSVIIGNNASSHNDSAVSIGSGAISNGNSVVIGNDAKASSITDVSCVAIGHNTISSSQSISIGDSSQANGESSVCIGMQAVNSGVDSVCIGREVNNTSDNSLVYGPHIESMLFQSTTPVTIGSSSDTLETIHTDNINMRNDGLSEIFNVFRVSGSNKNSLFLTGNTMALTAKTQDVNLRALNSSGCIRFRVGSSASIDRFFVCNTELKTFVPLNMNTQDIINANVIVRASNGNVIELDKYISSVVSGALTIESGTNKELLVSSGAGLGLNSTNGTSYNAGNGSHLFSNTPDGNILTLSSEIGANKNLNMNDNDIVNVTRIEGNTGQDMVLYSDDGITIAARDPMIINALDGDGIVCQTSSNTRMVITSAEIDMRLPINMNTNLINNVVDPVSGQDAATKAYVDDNTGFVSTADADLDMNGNDIKDASVIVRQSNGNLIDFDVGGGLELQSGVGNNIEIKAGSDRAQISGGNAILSATGAAAVQGGLASIGETTTNMSMLFQSSAASIQQGLTNIASFTPTRIAFLQNLDMNNNNILNTGDVALTSLNTNVIYVPDGTMPTSFVADRTYIFLGSRSTATPIVLPAGTVTLKGMSRENSTIEYTGSGALFTSTDQNLTIQDLGWSCTNTAGYFLDATNAAKDKLLTIQNCEFREAYQVMEITGYDLVDFQNNVLTYIRSGALGPSIGVNCIDVSKLEINSCEFIRWYQFGQPPNTNPFVGNMINISGANGASQITNNIIHPRVAQNGIDIDTAATFGAGVNITGNTFVNAGLTVGLILVTNSNADYDQKGITEANTLLPNLKARVGAQLSAANTITTATSATPADINLNNLLVPFSSFGVLVGTGGGVTYKRTRPVNFQVTFVANLLANNGGSGQRVGLTVSKNGVNTGINSFVTLTSSGTVPQSVTLTLIGEAVQGDVFRSQLVNKSGNSNITCTDLIVSGVEI